MVSVPSSSWLALYWRLHKLNSCLPLGDRLGIVLQNKNQSFVVCGESVGIYRLIGPRSVSSKSTGMRGPSSIPLHSSPFLGNTIFNVFYKVVDHEAMLRYLASTGIHSIVKTFP